MDTGFPVETKIKRINSRNLEEKEDEEEPIDIVFTEQKQILIMIKILLTLNDRMYTKKTRLIAISYLIKRKIKQIFLEVISNNKILNINFFMKMSTIKVLPNLQRDYTKGGGT